MTTVSASPGIESVLAKHDRARSSLIPILQDVQDLEGFLSEQGIAAISGYLGISENDVFGVATFYTQFRFTPPAEHRIKVCDGTACHVRGSDRIMEELGRRLGIEPGGTTDDRRFGLERVACFGSCAMAPVVVIDDKVHGRMTVGRADKHVEDLDP